MLKKLFFFSAASLLVLAHAGAQTTDSLDAEDQPDTATTRAAAKKVHELDPVSVRSTRASTNAPFAKNTLTAADIEKNNLGQDLPVLLQFTPSSTTTSDAG